MKTISTVIIIGCLALFAIQCIMVGLFARAERPGWALFNGIFAFVNVATIYKLRALMVFEERVG